MTAPFLICVLLPLVFLLQYLDRPDAGALGRVRAWLGAWPSNVLVTRLLVAGSVLLVLATTIVISIHESPLLFDDSFISYRYAKNLGLGDGLRWNPGETASEGYTNFLLVVLLAPLIRLGIDPLLATRVLSLLATAGMVAILFDTARRELGASKPVALIAALGVVTASFTIEISMVGLESVLFAGTLLASYYFFQRYFASERVAFLHAAGGACFAALLLRPEAAFLALAVSLVSLLLENAPGARERFLRGFALSFILPVALYLAWKLYYFGSIVPNPAFIKLPGAGLTRPRGVLSVSHFIYGHWKLILLMAIGIPLTRGDKRGQLICSLVLGAYLLFYLRVDTLMDVHGRFLYPAFPFLFMIALPVVVLFVDRFLSWQTIPLLRLALGGLVFLVFFYQSPGEALERLAHRGRIEPSDDVSVHQTSSVLKQIGLRLAAYPAVRQVTVGSTDAGLLPYVSGVRHIDMAGLVTRFIAVHKDPVVLSNYFFSQHPDLIITRTTPDGNLITDEHGVLGDYTLWSRDHGWDAYTEVGAAHASPVYNLHFFLLRGSPHEAALRTLLTPVEDQDALPVQAALGSAAN